jgi:hypothetical protein
MNRYISLAGIAIGCALIVAANASTARCQFHDPLGIHNQHKPWGKYGPTITYPSPTKVMNVVNGRPNRQTTRRVAQRVSPSRTERFDDLNLSVTMPGGAWTKVDPKEAGSRARYMIRREDPTIVISFASERAIPDAYDTLLAESQAKMMSLPGGAIEPGERQLSAGDIQGIVYAATVADGQFTTYYAIWLATHNGYHCKLAVYGDADDQPAIDAALRNFVHGIKPSKTTRVARAGSRQKSARR